MLGGISDRLVIGFDSSGDDKACLTVCRFNGRGYQVINTIYDTDAEDLYERLIGEKKEVIHGKVNDDYIIEVDSLNYTVKRDEHRTREEKVKDSDEVKVVPVFTIVGYYCNLPDSIRGVIKDMNRRELGAGIITLQEAVDIVLKNNRLVTKLLDKVEKEARYNED